LPAATSARAGHPGRYGRAEEESTAGAEEAGLSGEDGRRVESLSDEAGPAPSRELTTIARFRDVPDAELAAGSLEASGIECFLADVETIGVYWTSSQAVGWVRLQVFRDDLEPALELLASDLTSFIPAEQFDGPREPCPSCGSDYVFLEKGSRWAIPSLQLSLLPPLALLVLPVAGPLWRSRLACRSCGWTVRLPFRVRPEIVIALTITAVALVLAVSGLPSV